MVILAIIQGILGQVSNYMWREGKPPALFPDKIHWYLGRLVLLLAVVSVYLGLDQFAGDTSSYIFYSCHVGLTIAFVIFLEYRVGQTVLTFPPLRLPPNLLIFFFLQGEYEEINASSGKTRLEPSPILLVLYWAISSVLVGLTLIFALT